jgi:prepilin-type N-terminal cleavage/methylation domain-containing protein
MFTSLNQTKRGFTLIELLVVIAIIGILSSVVLASLGTARQKARDATRISDMKNIQLALELFFDSNQGYPQNTVSTANAHYITGVALNAALVGASLYLPVMPNDPQVASRAVTEEYVYQGLDAASADCTGAAGTMCASFFLGATLERPDNPVLDNDSGDGITIVGGVRGLGATSCDQAVGGLGGNGTTEQCYSIQP